MKILIALLFINCAWAIPEQDLSTLWEAEVLPNFQTMPARLLTNSQGMKIRYYSRFHQDNSVNIVILPGRTEPALKYAELIYDLKDVKANLFIMDHQGQGESDRILKDKHKGHVIYFSNYVNDFKQFMNEVVLPKQNNKPLYLIAHSMGATISTKYMAEKSSVFTKAVLNCPMYQVNTEPYSESVARLITSFLVKIGKGQNYAPDRGPYKPDEDIFERSDVTHSRARFNYNKELFTQRPDIALGGPTARWVNQSLLATKTIHLAASKIKTPILMFQSGLDLIVRPARQNAFCENANCKLIRFENAHHEILMEEDSIRNEALSHIRLFLGL